MNKTNIAWTDFTWNPVTGCTAVSGGCKNCYAKAVHERFNDTPFSEIVFHEDRLLEPSKMRKPAKIFVGSMTDLFQDGVTDEMLDSIFRVILYNPHHTFQVLTKRPERMEEYFDRVYQKGRDKMETMEKVNPAVAKELEKYNSILPNLWLGVTVENQESLEARIPVLLDTPAAKRFISVEPLVERIKIGNIGRRTDKYGKEVTHEQIFFMSGSKSLWDERFGFNIPLRNIDHPKLDWIIVGGESGTKSKVRPMDPEWVQHIFEACKETGVPFFFKQWGAHKPYLGKEPRFEYEEVQEFPDE